MSILNNFKARAVNRIQATDFQTLEEDYNLLYVEKEQIEKDYNDLKKQFDDAMVTLFFGQSEVQLAQRNYYFLLANTIGMVIIFITILLT